MENSNDNSPKYTSGEYNPPKVDFMDTLNKLSARVKALENNTKGNTLQAAGFTFEVNTTPKQDLCIHGENKVGRPGAAITINDGEKSYTIAKIDWDHQRELYVLSTGKGVNQ
jgi:hypothetical protein